MQKNMLAIKRQAASIRKLMQSLLIPIRQFFIPPVFPDDEDKNRSARILYALLVNMLLTVLIAMLGTIFIFVQKTGVSITLLAMFIWILISRALVQRGRVLTASRLFIIGSWIIFTLMLLLIGRVSTSIAAAHIAITVMAGILLGKRPAIITAITSSIIGLGLAILETMGYPLVHFFPAPPLSSWVVWVLALVMTITPLNLTLQISSQSLARARQSEKRYMTLFEEAPVMYLTNYDDRGILTIANCNAAFLESLGYQRNQVIGQPLTNFYTPQSQAELEKEDGFYHVLRDKAKILAERDLVAQDGHIIKTLLQATPEIDDAGQVIGTLAVFIDITKRKRAEAALRESEARIKSISNNLISGMIYQLVIKPDGTRQFTYLSDSVQELYGITPAEGMADSALIYGKVHEDDIERLIKTEEEALKNLSTFRSEARVREPSGKIRWSSFVSTPTLLDDDSVRWDGFEFIITDRKQVEENLQKSEERYRLLFENVPVGLYRTTPTGQILDINMAGARMFGFDLSEDTTKYNTLDFWVNPDERKQVLSSLNEQGNVDVETQFKRRDQTVMWLRNKSTVTRDSQGQILYIEGSLEDITEQKRKDAEINANQIELQHLLEESNQSRRALLSVLEDQKAADKVIHRRLAELEAVNHISATLRVAQTSNEMLPLLLDEALTALESEAGAIWLYQPEEKSLNMVAGRGWCKDFKETSLEPEVGVIGTVFKNGKPYISQELTNELLIDQPLVKRVPEHWSGVFMPIRTAEEVTGIILISIQRPREMTAEQTTLLIALAEMAGTALHRLRLFEKSQKDAAELQLAYDTTLEGWARALELRDQETEGHMRRVVDLTIELAKQMGFRDDDIDNIRRGAFLHDIGKMGIPDAILLKPGTLDEREWEIMRRHTEYARHLITPIEYLRPVLPIPTCHHEKWDGTGYPNSLKGEEIPLEARIFAIVDVWDALTNDRPYRSAWSQEDTLNYIRQQSGIHFDPKVVEAFLRLVEDGTFAKSNNK